MHVVADISDGWERFANALSPTPPFPKNKQRLRLAAVVVSMLFGSLHLDSYMFMKMNGFAVGFGMFGDPLIWRGLSYCKSSMLLS